MPKQPPKERLEPCSVYLPPYLVVFLRALGNGNVSAGIRSAALLALAVGDVPYPQKDEGT